MAIPRVFLSSTCYDLKYIRENLKFSIRGMGYEPVLSEEGDVYFDPTMHTHDSCLKEVENCQLFVLIIGGRFGGRYKGSERSITNMEYRRAVQNGIPVFALVERSVYNEYYVYEKNKDNPGVKADSIRYPSVDSPKIFEFINEVRRAIRDNDIVPFSDFTEMAEFLKKQWAGMLYSFLESRKRGDERLLINSVLFDLKELGTKTQDLLRFMTLNISKDEGRKEIAKIDAKSVVERFVDLLQRSFEMDDRIRKPLLEHITACTEFPPDWPTFLSQHKLFRIQELPNMVVKDRTEIGIISSTGGMGRFIGFLDKSGKRVITADQQYNDLQQSYKDLVAINPKLRVTIVQQILAALPSSSSDTKKHSPRVFPRR